MPHGHNFRLLGQLDPAPLLARLAAGSDLWKKSPRETFPTSPHAMAESIMVRWVSMDKAKQVAGVSGLGSFYEVQNSVESEDYPAAAELSPQIGETVMEALDRVVANSGTPVAELGHVMLTRLPPGGMITPHRDEGVYADLFDRFHVCLAGGPGNVFRCGGELLSPTPGDVFWFNHKREHAVQNGAVERIHLIVDVMAPEFTKLRGVYYQAEPYADMEECIGLLRAHYAEVAHFKDIPLEPDLGAYAKLEQAGELRRYTVRDGARLVGYALFFVRRNHHYAGSLQAWQDVMYLDPDYRRWRTGIGLIRFAEARLKAEGVQVVYHHAKRTNRVGELLGRLGYELVDEIYAKRLDKRS